jgi:hypothetical protein
MSLATMAMRISTGIASPLEPGGVAVAIPALVAGLKSVGDAFAQTETAGQHCCHLTVSGETTRRRPGI